jgi:ASC-1-like (ASCH) protein
MSFQKVYKKHLSEPWFSLLFMGCKTVEGRLHHEDWEKMRQGDIIEWYNLDFTPLFDRQFKTIILSKKVYPSFESYLTNEGMQKTLPSIEKINDGLKIYYSYYKPEDEKKFGITAIQLKVIIDN